MLTADAFRNGWPLLALVIPGSRCVAPASRRWGVDGDETPRLSTSYTGTAILNLAGAPGRLARHLRRPFPGSGIHCAAEVSQMQTPTARVGQAAIVRRKTADVRYCPPQTVWLENMIQVTP